MQELAKLFDSFNDFRVLVIGDAMLDSYLWGKVDRISPEAPIPVVSVVSKENRLGGAGNVALNIKSMGAEPILCSVLGDDAYGQQFYKIMHEKGIRTDGIVFTENRPTTCKTRVIGKNQHMLRIDEEITNSLDVADETIFLAKVSEILINVRINGIIFQDYDKGLITPLVINRVVEIARKQNIQIFTDPKYRNFHLYKNTCLFKPNFKEFSTALNLTIDKNNIAELIAISKKFISNYSIDNLLLTLSENGLLMVSNAEQVYVKAHDVDIVDVSGAGDTVISISSLCFIAGANLSVTASVSNLAGALVCEKSGVVHINKEHLLQKCIANNIHLS
jgi:D-glycero-beta-D-manno-heptose-7-phosphate kinase